MFLLAPSVRHAAFLSPRIAARSISTTSQNTLFLRSLSRTLLRAKPTPFFLRNVHTHGHKAKPPPANPPRGSTLTTPPSDQPRLLDRLRAAGQISQDTAPPVLSTGQRLLRPTIFAILVAGGSLYYGYTWTAPKPSERWFPTVPIAFATVASIMAINAMVFVAWRVPLPITWRTLNRYFISVPALPYSLSILGSVFSHQTLSHLGMNMFVLYMFGTSLCEQIGSGPFVGLYLSGGVLSSLASLTYNVVRQRFHVCSLGASGAISALIGAYAYINPDAQLYVIFLPFVALKAKYFIGVLAAVETLGIVRGWQVMDHVAHLGGLAWGVGFGYALMEEYKRRLERERKELKKRGFGW